MNFKLVNKNSLEKNIFQDMAKQFPPEEMKSFEEFNRLLKNRICFLDLFYADENLAGYIIYGKFDFLWIDYLAILKPYQSMGFGTKILEIFFEKFKNLKGCYFEVEKENSADINTTKRINFYKKSGCELADFKYYYPNDLRITAMNLFYKQLSSKCPDKNEIYEDIKKIFAAIHSDVKCKNDVLNLIKKENNI